MRTEDFKRLIKTTPTRFADNTCALHVGKFNGFWQAVIEQDGQMNQTGAQCKTKLELFAYLPTIAEQWSFR